MDMGFVLDLLRVPFKLRPTRVVLCGAVLFGLLSAPAVQGQQLLDDFTRANSATVGGPWTEGGTSGGEILTNQLRLIAPAAANGREWVSTDVSALYNTTLASNSCVLTWAFNIRFSRSSPSGLDNGNYGAAVALAGTTLDPTAGQGYGIVIGNSGAPDPVRLVRYNGGLDLNANYVSLLTFGITDAQYLGVQVTFDPGTGTWEMFVTNNGGPFSSPLVAGTSAGTIVDNTYTAANLRYVSAVYNHAASLTENVLIDNFYVPSQCPPTVNFASTGSTVGEAVGPVVVTMNFNTPAPAGTITVSASDGAGVTYPGDYTTFPAVVAGNISVNVLANAMSVSFTVNVINDVAVEGNETITFVISNATGGIVLGTQLTYTLTIVDNDGPPAITFLTTNISQMETVGGPHTFNLSISPAASAAGSITIQVTNGPGAVYGPGNDYLTAPGIVLGNITLVFANTATAASFTVTLLNDVIVELTETVTFTIIGATGGATVGTTNVATLNIGDNDSPATVLTAGDIAIVGVNANNFSCSGVTGEDWVSFFCFKPIVPGTSIILTDNGYERCNAGRWGNSEGTVAMTRTGMAIPAGQVITFRITNIFGPSNIIAAAPDNQWTCASLNGNTTLNLNSGGDQLFFMQGGMWTTNTPGGHDAQYSGTPLYGFSTYPAFPWSANCFTNPTLRSNLPIGMNCFSMAPTGASDFNKYTGPISAASQRDWLIRIDSPANWTSYGGCSPYFSGTPIWLTAPTLPIINTPFVPGLWRGTTSTDWFDCKNWDDVAVPVAATNVRIDDIASRNCVVGITPGGSAVCATLLMTNAGAAWNLTVQNTSSLATSGTLTMERTAAGTGIVLDVLGNSTLTASDLLVRGINPNDATFRNTVPGNLVSFNGNVTLDPGGAMNLQGAGLNGGTISLTGNYANNTASEAALNEINGTFRFNGTGVQSISTPGFEEVFYNLTLLKPSGNLTLNAPTAVTNSLNLTNGRVFSSAVDLLSLRAGASAINYTDASYVDGPMQKIGSTNFTFPVGKNGNLRPCGLLGIAGAVGDAFTAEYFPITAYTWGSAMEPTLDHVSACEYWLIDRSVGASNATVVLTWDTPESCGVSNPPDLMVARWDAVGAIWRDRGNGGASPMAAFGTVPTGAVQSLFNGMGPTPWTLASINMLNPLPIELLSFTARVEEPNVRLDWTTASEQDNAYFTVERSDDGVAFAPIVHVPGAGNSHQLVNYAELDRAPLPGLSYYRLRQTDLSGESVVSNVVTVIRRTDSAHPLVAYRDADQVVALHDFSAGSRYELLDMLGRRISEGIVLEETRSVIGAVNLQHGAYLLRMDDGTRMESVRFVY